MRWRNSGKSRESLRPDGRPGKAALAGAMAGLAGAWAMSAFSAGWEKLLPASAGRPQPWTVNIGKAQQRHRPPMHASQQEWDTTLNTATAVARKLVHWPLSLRQRERAAVAVHYAVGATFGAFYSVAREYVPQVASGGGAPFGMAVFVLAQEIEMPRMGLSKPAGQYSLAMHANSLGEHVVWGITTELVGRALRRLL